MQPRLMLSLINAGLSASPAHNDAMTAPELREFSGLARCLGRFLNSLCDKA